MIKHIEKKLSDTTYMKGCMVTRDNMDAIYSILANSTHSDSEDLNTFLMETDYLYPKVAYLTVITVDFQLRGQGLGAQLLDHFLKEVESADMVFLMASLNAPQRTGIELKKFYQDRGFEIYSGDSYDIHSMFILIKTKKANTHK